VIVAAGNDGTIWEAETLKTVHLNLTKYNYSNRKCPSWIHCEWEVPAVLNYISQSDCRSKCSAEKLSTVVVITGCGAELEANTCGGYLEREWGDIGKDLLQGVIHSLSNDNSNRMYGASAVQ
jgi:hypothetical protein